MKRIFKIYNDGQHFEKAGFIKVDFNLYEKEVDSVTVNDCNEVYAVVIDGIKFKCKDDRGVLTFKGQVKEIWPDGFVLKIHHDNSYYVQSAGCTNVEWVTDGKIHYK
jgi:hypothetical protein